MFLLSEQQFPSTAGECVLLSIHAMNGLMKAELHKGVYRREVV